jgi:hypothetical protein
MYVPTHPLAEHNLRDALKAKAGAAVNFTQNALKRNIGQ